MWESFSQVFRSLWDKESVEKFTTTPHYFEHVLEKIFKDAIGFAGCEIIRRTIGLAHVADLDSIQPDAKRINIKKQALSLGKALIIDRELISSTSALEELINMKELKES